MAMSTRYLGGLIGGYGYLQAQQDALQQQLKNAYGNAYGYRGLLITTDAGTASTGTYEVSGTLPWTAKAEATPNEAWLDRRVNEMRVKL